MNDMDKLLNQALEEMVKEDYANRPQNLPEHQFSAKFRRKIKRAIRMLESPGGNELDKSCNSLLELYRPIHSKRRWIAIALLILMLVGGSVLAAEPIIQWLNGFQIEQKEDHVRIQNEEVQADAEEDKGEFRKYRLKEVPEGFTLKSEKYEEEFQKYYVTYSNSEEEVLFLKQIWQESGDPEILTSDVEPLEDVNMNGFTGYYVEDRGIGSLIISNGIYELVLNGTFSKEELIKLAEKLELVSEPIK